MTDHWPPWDGHTDLGQRLEHIWHVLIEEGEQAATVAIDDFCEWWLARRAATHLAVAIQTHHHHHHQGEHEMPVAVEIIDTDTGAKAVASWTDVMDQPTSAPANAAPLVFSSDTPTVATVATDATNGDQGDITPVAVGNFNVLVAVPLDTSGNPLLEADGVTPFAAPAPTPAAIEASAATGLSVVVTA